MMNVTLIWVGNETKDETQRTRRAHQHLVVRAHKLVINERNFGIAFTVFHVISRAIVSLIRCADVCVFWEMFNLRLTR